LDSDLPAGNRKNDKLFFTVHEKQTLTFYLTLICAGCVLNAAEVSLVPDADGVVHLGEHQAGRLVVVKGGHTTRHSSEVLQAPGIRCSREDYEPFFTEE
jgi:hypothetical protein